MIGLAWGIGADRLYIVGADAEVRRRAEVDAGRRGRGRRGGNDERLAAPRVGAAELLAGRVVGHLHLLLTVRTIDHVRHGHLFFVKDEDEG